MLELCRSNLKGITERHIFHITMSFRLFRSIVQTYTVCMVVINSFLVIWYLCLEFTGTTYLLVIMKLPTHYNVTNSELSNKHHHHHNNNNKITVLTVSMLAYSLVIYISRISLLADPVRDNSLASDFRIRAI